MEPVLSDEGDISADVVIVGSGIVGGMIANELASSGYSVVVLEAGLRKKRTLFTENWRNVSFHNRLNSDFQGIFSQLSLAPAPPYFPPNDYIFLPGPDGDAFRQGYLRIAGGGGTTWHWAVSCWRHMPQNFQMKTRYGVGGDWFISCDDLEPYYCRAEDRDGCLLPDIHETVTVNRHRMKRPYGERPICHVNRKSFCFPENARPAISPQGEVVMMAVIHSFFIISRRVLITLSIRFQQFCTVSEKIKGIAPFICLYA